MARKPDEDTFFIDGEEYFILLDDLGDWIMSKKVAEEFRQLWEENVPFADMCSQLDMDGDTLLILIIHLMRKRLIERRKIGIGI